MDCNEYVTRMKEIAEHSRRDEETGHIQADELLIDFLNDQGHTELAEAYRSVKKWYS